jgi:hypothetical protein
MNKKVTLMIVALIAACFLSAAPAQAHLVAFGWNDNGNGTITMFGEHWHGDLSSPYSDNGGVRIGVFGSDNTLWPVFQWTGVMNNLDRDDMLASGQIDGYAVEPVNGPTEYRDWLTTDPLVLGNGTWGLFTGTACCVDTMSAPGQFVITGISSVPAGTGPGQANPTIPEPATMALLGSGLLGFVGMRRKHS